jgi:hypothetical protein
LLQGGPPVPFFQIDQGIPAAMIYFIALVFHWTGPVAESGRIVSLAFGALMLFVLPMAAAWFFSNSLAVGVFTAVQVAFTFWFVNFSRIGLEQMTCAWFITDRSLILNMGNRESGTIGGCPKRPRSFQNALTIFLC